jgi:hypothetical protein
MSEPSGIRVEWRKPFPLLDEGVDLQDKRWLEDFLKGFQPLALPSNASQVLNEA